MQVSFGWGDQSDWGDDMSIKSTRSILTLKRIGCAVVLGIPIVVVVALMVYHRQLDDRVRAALDAVVATGAPMTPEELDASYVVPEEENAAEGLRSVVEEFSLVCPLDVAWLPLEGDGTMPEPWEPIPEGMLASIDEYLELNKEVLDTAREGVTPGRARWPVDFRGHSGMPEHLTPILRLAKAFELDAVSRAIRGDAEGAVRDIEAQTLLAGCLADEPMPISQIMRHCVIDVAADTVKQVNGRAALSAEQLDRVAGALRRIEPVNSMVLGLTGERCLVFSKFQEVAAGEYMPEEVAEAGVTHWIRVLLGLYKSDSLHVLAVQSGCIAIARLPAHEQWAQICAIRSAPEPPPSLSMARDLRTSLSHMLTWEPRAVAGVRAAQVAVAAEQYRVDHGEYPDSAEAFGDPLPTDPFDGNPIRYRREPDGFVSYSVNANGVDDGGHEHKDGEKWSEGDLVFRVRRATE